MKKQWVRTLVAVCLLTRLASADAGEREELEVLRQTTLSLIQLLVQSGILTQEKADALIQQAKRSAAQSAAAPGKNESKVVRVPYVPQHVRDEMKEELRQEIVAQARGEGWAQQGAVPEWTQRIKVSGDIRLRHQEAYQSDGNAQFLSVQDTNTGGGIQLLNTSSNISADRLRMRLALEMNIAESWIGGVRITTGDTNTPVSTNQTLGRTFNRGALTLDQAWLSYRPSPTFNITGGRIPNPFFHTDLLWAEDLSFDGVAATYAPKLTDSTGAWVTAGAFPLETIDCSVATQVPNCDKNKRLYALQAGLEHAFADSSRVKVGAAYYDFTNVAGELNLDPADPGNRTRIPKFAQKGNTVFNIRTDPNALASPLLGLASDFRLVNLTGSYEIAAYDPTFIVLVADYVKNIGYDREQIRNRTGGAIDQEPRTTGYAGGITVGQRRLEKLGDWQGALTYKYLERDAVIDAFTDPNFRLGGTNAKGWILSGSYGVAKNTWLRLRWLTAKEIDGPPLSIDVLQFDVNARF